MVLIASSQSEGHVIHFVTDGISIIGCDISNRAWIWWGHIGILTDTCYSQNGLGHQEEGQVIYFKSDDLYTIGCEISRRVWIWKGLLHILCMAPVIAIMVIIAKNGIVETSQKYNICYVTKTGFSSKFRIWSQNSNIPSVSKVIAWFV